MIQKHLGKIILLAILIIVSTIIIFFGFKTFLFIISLFSLMMYLNITITTLANAFIGRDINPNYDIFWKLLFIIISCIGFGIYLNY